MTDATFPSPRILSCRRNRKRRDTRHEHTRLVRCRFVGRGGVSAFLLDHRVETVIVVGGVLDRSRGTVRLDQAVETLDVAVTVARLGLALHVVRGGVVHAVLEPVRFRGVRGFRGVSLRRGVNGHVVSGREVCGRWISGDGVLAEGGRQAGGERDNLKSKQYAQIVAGLVKKKKIIFIYKRVKYL